MDLASTWDRWAVDQIGSSFGFAKRWSDAQSEWWHIKYNPGIWHGHAPPPAPRGPRALRQGMRGRDVAEVQTYLLRGGYLHKAKPGQHHTIDGVFGPGTKHAVQAFQRHVKLPADGVVGPKTIAALRRRYKKR